MELGAEAQGLRASRRNVVRGAAWSVPVVAVATAAPAFAASPCDVTAYTLTWSGGTTAAGRTSWNRTSRSLGVASVGAPSGSLASAVSVTFASSWIGGASTDRRDPDLNLTQSSGNVGGTGGHGLYVRHESPIADTRDQRQEITISFGRPVTGLAFTITDIDSAREVVGKGKDRRFEGFRDQLELSPLPTTATPVPTVSGIGTQASPWQQTTDNNHAQVDESIGNVAVSYAGPVSSVKLVFWSSQAWSQQAIYLSNFRFNAKGC